MLCRLFYEHWVKVVCFTFAFDEDSGQVFVHCYFEGQGLLELVDIYRF